MPEAVPTNRSDRLPAPAMPAAALAALRARRRLHIHGWAGLRLPALPEAGQISCCQTPQGSLRFQGMVSGMSGQHGDRQLGGLGSGTTQLHWGWLCLRTRSTSASLKLKCSQRLTGLNPKGLHRQSAAERGRLQGEEPGC